jgi:hypothetical protein
MHEDDGCGTAVALLQVAIVLASAEIITGTATLAWVAGALGLRGVALRVTRRWCAPADTAGEVVGFVTHVAPPHRLEPSGFSGSARRGARDNGQGTVHHSQHAAPSPHRQPHPRRRR